jgi:hypothetical protein
MDRDHQLTEPVNPRERVEGTEPCINDAANIDVGENLRACESSCRIGQHMSQLDRCGISLRVNRHEFADLSYAKEAFIHLHENARIACQLEARSLIPQDRQHAIQQRMSFGRD